jgi:hypothetical protein
MQDLLPRAEELAVLLKDRRETIVVAAYHRVQRGEVVAFQPDKAKARVHYRSLIFQECSHTAPTRRFGYPGSFQYSFDLLPDG